MSIRIRDPIHNFITLNSDEAKIVGTRSIQRLRGIRQLAMAFLVYPGALHTRFDHTLGVTHVAGLMADELVQDKDHRYLIRKAALLHDIGHGPFSHVSEYALDLYGDRKSLSSTQKKEKIHELVTASLIEHDEELGKIISPVSRHNVMDLLRSGFGPRTLRNIVSGPLDADKQDYLLRDSQFCGVEYGKFDLHQLHRSLAEETVDDDECQLMIKDSGLHAVEQFVLAKYYMTADVYRHKVRTITDQMIVRAIVSGIDLDQIEDLKKLYAFDNTPEFARRYAQWDDSRFIEAFCRQKPGTKCASMLERLIQRQLLKRILHVNTKEIASEARENVRRITNPDQRSNRRALEFKITEIIKKECPSASTIEADQVILHHYSIKSVREMSRNDEAEIMVKKPCGPPVPFTEASTLFKSIEEKFSDAFVDVYAPVNWQTHDDRKRILKKLKGCLMHTINDHCSQQMEAMQ